MKKYPQISSVLYVRPFCDFIVKRDEKGLILDETDRAIDSLEFARFLDDDDVMQCFDQLSEFRGVVIDGIDTNLIEENGTGYLWVILTESLILNIMSAFAKLPVELRSCDESTLNAFLNRHIGLEIIVNDVEN